jgi:hypothetical protein
MLLALVTAMLLVGGARSYSLKQPMQWLRDVFFDGQQKLA